MADCVNLYILLNELKSVVGQFIIFANFEKKNHQTLNTSFDIWKIKLKNEKEKRSKKKNLSYNKIDMRVCDLHVCMCFCGHFDEERKSILPTFFFKKT